MLFVCLFHCPRQLSIAPLNAMNEDQIQSAALSCISELWPGVGIRELRSGSHDWGIVFARWTFAHLLSREAGLSRKLTVEMANWRSGATLVSAMKALDLDCTTNRARARKLAEAVNLFRRLLEKKIGRTLALEAPCPPGQSSCHRPCKRAATARQAMLRGHPEKTEQPACGQIAGPWQRAGKTVRTTRIPSD
jgi:hypothetical protein